MKFRYNANTFIIESDDPRIYAKRLQAGRVPFSEILLVVGDKRFGFRTAIVDEEESLPRRDDGLTVWQIDFICHRISRWDMERRAIVDLTNVCEFANREEQKYVLETLARALEVFDGKLWPTDPCSVKACVEYTERAANQIESGNLIR